MLGKVDVNGDATEPVFTWLKTRLPGMLKLKRIKWNFEKFLVSADGQAVQRWSSISKPESMRETIISEIKKIPDVGEPADKPSQEGVVQEGEAKTGSNL